MCTPGIISKAHSEPSQMSKMEFLAEIVNSFQLLTIVAKSSILLASEHA